MPFIFMIAIQTLTSIIFNIVTFINEPDMVLNLLLFAFTLIFVCFFIVMILYRAKFINEKSKNLEDRGTAAV